MSSWDQQQCMPWERLHKFNFHVSCARRNLYSLRETLQQNWCLPEEVQTTGHWNNLLLTEEFNCLEIRKEDMFREHWIQRSKKRNLILMEEEVSVRGYFAGAESAQLTITELTVNSKINMNSMLSGTNHPQINFRDVDGYKKCLTFHQRGASFLS